jgi:hypothetical protein
MTENIALHRIDLSAIADRTVHHGCPSRPIRTWMGILPEIAGNVSATAEQASASGNRGPQRLDVGDPGICVALLMTGGGRSLPVTRN